MAQFQNDLHFQDFIAKLDKNIENYDLPKDAEGFYKVQKAQVERLVKLEKQFRKILVKDANGPKVYRDFITYIMTVKRNILSACPFFRERQEVFTEFISGAIKEANEAGLFRFNVNYQFINFAIKSRAWPKKGRLYKLYNEIKDLRVKIAELNMPLAISRARIFWSRTPKSQLTYMDLVQISCEGLMSAIDKFVPPFGKVFRAVIIGRITGNFIEEYSETLVHFYPNDKRKIYRANKAVRALGGVADADFDILTEKVNEGMDKINRTNPIELRDLLGAASTVSADSSATEEAGETVTQLTAKFADKDENRPDIRNERADLRLKVGIGIEGLSLFEQKLLKLKGISL